MITSQAEETSKNNNSEQATKGRLDSKYRGLGIDVKIQFPYFSRSSPLMLIDKYKPLSMINEEQDYNRGSLFWHKRDDNTVEICEQEIIARKMLCESWSFFRGNNNTQW